jgi:hypothetical protein
MATKTGVRSVSTTHVSLNLPHDSERLLRQWAHPFGGRIGLIVERLIQQEKARREQLEIVRFKAANGADRKASPPPG